MSEKDLKLRSTSRFRSFSIRFLLFLVLLASLVAWYIGDQLNREIAPPVFWDFASQKNVKWTSQLGSQTCSQPVVSERFVFIGTNNGAGYDPKISKTFDRGVMLCFDKHDGTFLWQYAHKKLEVGRISDWPLQGITSSPCAKDGCVWYVSNRGEVVCLDQDGFLDGTNDGAFQSELDQRPIDGDVIWLYDMIKELGVFPHNLSHCNVKVDDHRVYVKTSNGVDETHINLPAPDAASFVVLDRETGEIIWHDNPCGESIMHGSWGSATLATIEGRVQILFPGGDGWLYSYVPEGDGNGNPKLLWKFDCNPKISTWGGHGMGQGRNNLLTEPTVEEDRIYLTMGQDPQHGGGESRVWCIEPKLRTGDVSPTLVVRGDKTETPAPKNGFRHCIVENGDREIRNPNSAEYWEYVGGAKAQTGTVEGPMSRSLSRVVIGNGCAFVTDIDGFLHCIDQEFGIANWRADLLSGVWTSPHLIGGYVFVGTEDGQFKIFSAQHDPKAANFVVPVATIDTLDFNSIYSNSTFKDGVLYYADRTKLHAVEDANAKNRIQKWLKK